MNVSIPLKPAVAILVGLVLATGVSCARKFDYSINDPQKAYDKAQNTAESLQGYDMLWKCVGRTFDSSNEFLVATLQRHPVQLNMILTVDRVVISQNAASYSRYGIFMSEVTSTLIDPELELVAYTPKNQESLPIEQRRMLAKRSSKSQLLVLDLIRYADHSISINCPTGDIFY